MLDLIFYAYIKRAYEKKNGSYRYATRAFYFSLFLNFATIYFLLKAAKIINLHLADEEFWGFVFSGLFAALITYMFHKRKSRIINKYKNKNKGDMQFLLFAHLLASFGLFVAAIVRNSSSV